MFFDFILEEASFDLLQVRPHRRQTLSAWSSGIRLVGKGDLLIRGEHHSNWILEHWAVRERSLTLFRANPQSLIDPISPDELHQVVRARLNDWAEWAQTLDDPECSRRAATTYVVETMVPFFTSSRAESCLASSKPYRGQPKRFLTVSSYGCAFAATSFFHLLPEMTTADRLLSESVERE